MRNEDVKNELVQFNFCGNEVRVIERDGEPWFVAKDVACVLGYANTRKAIIDHCKGGNETLLPSAGGKQTVKIIPERDVYRLIMRSKLPAAEAFEEWVVGEVLPAVRKHGGYMTPQTVEDVLNDPDTIIRLATNLKEERARRMSKERELAKASAKALADAPKVAFADSIAASDTSILIRDLAKDIKSKLGINIGGNRLFDWMRENGYLISRGSDRNMPTQRSIDLGIMEVNERTITSGSSRSIITRTTKITGKGQIYFFKKFGETK